MYHKAKAHFKKADPKLHAASLLHDVPDLKTTDNLFRDIVWTIIGQQLSGKAADSIFARFEVLFPNKMITTSAILKLDEPTMRTAGLSGAKARAIRSLAENVQSGTLNLEIVQSLPDHEVVAELTKVKGIGPWTAEMILMFSLGRPDVFSIGDLGLRNGIIHLYGLKKLPGEKKLKQIVDAWSPWRTYASRVLWRVADSKKKVTTMRKRPTK